MSAARLAASSGALAASSDDNAAAVSGSGCEVTLTCGNPVVEVLRCTVAIDGTARSAAAAAVGTVARATAVVGASATCLVCDIPAHVCISDIYSLFESFMDSITHVAVMVPLVDCSKGPDDGSTLAAASSGRQLRAHGTEVGQFVDQGKGKEEEREQAEELEEEREGHVGDVCPQYAMLVRFHDAGKAMAFRHDFDARPYSSLEPMEVCVVVPVLSIRYEHPNKHIFPLLFASPMPLSPSASQEQAISPSAVTAVSTNCAVCLDDIEPASDAVITILCNHAFHFRCLSMWADSTCPVCRYSMEPEIPSVCSVCGSTEHLWLCLVCGHIGCSRYTGGHAVAHFDSTGHMFASDITTQRVWDYASDNFVHRLALDTGGQKPVEVHHRAGRGRRRRRREMRPRGRVDGGADDDDGPHAMHRSNWSGDGGIDGNGEVGDNDDFDEVLAPLPAALPLERGGKLEQMLQEYNHLLSSQLQQQRQYFERRLARTSTEAKDAIAAGHRTLRSLGETLVEAKARLSNETKLNDELKQERESVCDELLALRRRHASLKKLNQRLLSAQCADTRAAKGRAKHLTERHDRELAALDTRKADLEDQVRDLEFFLSTQRKISRTEAAGGRVMHADAFSSGSSSGKR